MRCQFTEERGVIMTRGKIKKVLCSAAFLAIVFALHGCAPEQKENTGVGETETKGSVETAQKAEETQSTETTQTTAETAEKIDFPETYQETVNDVVFDLKVETPKEAELGNLTKYRVERQYPDSASARTALVSEKTGLEENITSETGENGETDRMSLSFEDGTYLSTSNSMVYSTSFAENVWNTFREPDKYSQDGVFDFKSPEDAFQEIVEKINASGYTLGDADYEYYALDAGTMAQEEVVYSKAGEVIEDAGRAWTDEDDSYYFFAEQTLSGIPVYNGYQDFPEDSLDNRSIQAVYSSRGLEYLYTTQIYSFTASEEKISLAGFDRAVECVAHKYGDLLTDAAYTATRAKLYWKPVKAVSGGHELQLVWLFELHETGVDSETGENFDYVLYTFVDAVTGEEVPI